MAFESALEPTTALGAVNDMLRSIGQGAVNTLSEFSGTDAANAAAYLEQTSREVQERGWYFNTDREFPFVPGANGEVALGATLLKFSPSRDNPGIVERQRKLYDTENHTFDMRPKTTIKGDVVWLFSFEELPQAARTYIHRKAGRMFQVGAVGSDLLYRFTREMEDDALQELTRAQLNAQRPNIFTDDPFMLARITAGRNYRG